MATFAIPYIQLEAHWSSFLSMNAVLQAITTPGQTVKKSQLLAARQTLANGHEYVNALTLWTALSMEYAALAQGLALPVPVSASVLATVQTRINTIKSVINDLNTLVDPLVLPTANFNVILDGETAFASIGFLEYVMAFNTETPPTSLTLSTFVSVLAQQSADWMTYTTALRTAYPTGQGEALDAFSRQATIAARMSARAGQFASLSGQFPLQDVWNWVAVWPSIAMTGALISNEPTSATGQSANVLRYNLAQMIGKIDTLIAAFAEQGYQNVTVITAMQNDSLPNIANRALGNYALWPEIAALNSIPPPYTLTAGQQLFLPPSTNANGSVPPNYLTNYLGVDLYYGPMGSDMLPWTGDFFLVSGYKNLEISLGRAIMTTQGTLLYHPTYGSRVPPEVGAIETANTATHLGAFANSAILADPRVNGILKWTVSMQPNNEIAYTSLVQPNGINASSVKLNLVLG